MSEAQPEKNVTGGTVVQDPGTAPPVEGHVEPGSANLEGVTLLGRYKITKKLGEGGMGTVYLAEHITIRKTFAIKVLSSEFAHKPDLVERFLQEARAASMIQQQNVVEITDFGDTPDGSVFFVMEHLRGEDLSDTVKNGGALPWDRVKNVMLQICDALAAAHDAGIIHRDMKPENCFRISRAGNDDFIKVLDFGIAKVTTDEGDGGKGLTRTGMIFGTPEYMSPEQAQGQKADTRVDVYASGVIMYELLTGRVPFTADTFMGILTKHMFDVPEAPSAVNPNNGITQEMEAIMLKAMQKDRELRFTDMREMKIAIEGVGTGAAAVAVVSESIARPDQGQMAFTGSEALPGTYPPQVAAGTYPPQGGTMPPMMDGGYRERSKAPLIIGIVALLGVLGGAGYYFGVAKPAADASAAAAADATAVKDAATNKALADAKAATDAAAAAAAAVPEPVAKQLDNTKPKVKVIIRTGDIRAQILDAADGAIFGYTDAEGGVEFEESKENVDLILRAEGYEDMAFSFAPERDKEFEKTLKKERKRTTTTKKKKKAASTGTTTKTKKVVLIPTDGKKKKKATKKGSGPQDLKDPFG